jgi:hypothetical protein
MNKYFYLILIGIVLITFGLTLTVIYSSSTYFWKQDPPIPHVIAINANSSAWVPFLVNSLVLGSSQITVIVFFPLGSTLMPLPITMTVYSFTLQGVEVNMTASEPMASSGWGYDSYVAMHVFNIPSNWRYITGVSIANPENYSVSWIVTLTFNQQITVSEAVDRTNLGITSTAVGAVILGVAVYRMKPLKNHPKSQHFDARAYVHD